MDMSGMNGMDMPGMDMGSKDMPGMDMGSKDKNDKEMAGMDMSSKDMPGMDMGNKDKNDKGMAGMDMSSMPGMSMDSKDKNGMDTTATPSMTGMSMSMPGSTAAAAMDMSGMGMSGMNMSSMSMSGMDMTMVFQANTHTPLYARAWTPDTTAAYAGTCLFLVGLSLLARCLLAFRAVQQARWRRRGKSSSSAAASRAKNHFVVDDELLAHADDAVQPWRLSVDPPRAVLDTVVVAVGYMIMLAVMTMNVGYFFSVLAGVFVGSLAVGRFSGATEH